MDKIHVNHTNYVLGTMVWIFFNEMEELEASY